MVVFAMVSFKMDYAVAIDNLQRLVNIAGTCLHDGLTYMEVLEQVRVLYNDAIISIDLIRKTQCINDLVRALFVGYNIKFVAGSKESYIKAIRHKASVAKWRFKTMTTVFTKLDKIYDMEHEQILAEREALFSVAPVEPQKVKEQMQINTNRLRRLLKRYGITLGDDFRRQVILDLVEKKAAQQKWRPDTIVKNMAAIIKGLDKNPLVTLVGDEEHIEPMYVHVSAEDYGLNMIGSKFD
jgi:hypothetical protein